MKADCRLVVAVIVAGLAGCGDSGSYKIARVSGRVTLDGKPFANASVVFSPIASASNREPGPGSGGITDAEGRYTLKVTGTNREGAVVGKHKVAITRVRDDDSGEDQQKQSRPRGVRRKRKTAIEFEVPAGGTEKADFELGGP
jgi:hypothetical protein